MSDSWIRIPLHRLGDMIAPGKPATGKEPRERGWQRCSESRPHDPDAYGILPGPSGLAVLDVEPAGLARFPDPGRGRLVRTPSLGFHLYLDLAATQTALGVTLVQKLVAKDGRAPIAELISFGGQVVGPGVRALSAKSNREGVYTLERNEPPLADVDAIRALLAPFAPKAPPRHVQAPIQRHHGRSARARAALDRETSAVLTAPAGARHDTLRVATSALASLIPGGELDEAEVREAMQACAQATQPDQIHEAMKCIEDAIRFGIAHPRQTLPHTAEPSCAIAIRPADSRSVPESIGHVTRDVLTPGAHLTDLGHYVEQSNGAFATQVLEALPPGTFYRRDTIVGFVEGGRFHQANEHTIRELCDAPHVRLAKWIKTKEDGQKLVYENCNGPLAQLVLSNGARTLPEIKLLTNYPVILPDRTVSKPGFHPESGTFYAGPEIEPMRDPDEIRAHLEDLVADFPFEDQSSRANFFGLMLTPMLRPLVGKTPLTLVTSPQAGTGKSRLIEEILGITYTGRPLPSSALPERQEEREKWVTALLLGGTNLLHLDNLPADLDSGSLASILTSASHRGRVLGSSSMPELPSTLTVAASGNNTQLSSELARRTVVVRLIWTGRCRPEERTDFRHASTLRYASESRARTLSALVGACTIWDGRPAGGALGSFEEWAGAVGGVLDAIGVDGHLGNRSQWRDRADSEKRALEALVVAWADEFRGMKVTAREIAARLPDALEGIGAKPGSSTSAGMKVSRYLDRSFLVLDRRLTLRREASAEMRVDVYWLNVEDDGPSL